MALNQVGRSQIAKTERAVEVEVGGESFGAGGAGPRIVDGGFADDQRFVGHLENQIGLADIGTGGQAASHGNTRQVVSEQQAAVKGVGIEFGAVGLMGGDDSFDLPCRHARGQSAFQLDAAEDGFDDLNGDDAVLDVLLGQVGIDHPAGSAISIGDGCGRCLQLGKVQGAVEIVGNHRGQLLCCHQGVAGETKLLNGDGHAGCRFHGSRGGLLGRGHALGQLLLALAVNLLLQGAGVGDGLRPSGEGC